MCLFDQISQQQLKKINTYNLLSPAGVFQYKEIKSYQRHHHQKKSLLDYDDNGDSLQPNKKQGVKPYDTPTKFVIFCLHLFLFTKIHGQPVS